MSHEGPKEPVVFDSTKNDHDANELSHSGSDTESGASNNPKENQAKYLH